jgi:circadian clock protein KaiC
MVSFIEDGTQLRNKARAFGMDLEGQERAGRIHVLSMPGYELDPDQVALQIREMVERHSVQRVVIDSIAELDRTFPTRDRAPEYFAALVHYLRMRGATSYLTLDIPKIVGPDLDLSALAVLAENLLLLRYVEYEGRLQRLMSILKMRASEHDRALQTFEIVSGVGYQLTGQAPPAEGLLTGVARPISFSRARHGRGRSNRSDEERT